MAKTKYPTPTPELIASDLHIEIWPRGWVEWTGSAAQLIGEGMLPRSVEWPKGFGDVRWSADGYKYWLRRARPKDAKGPRRDFLEVDHWWLRRILSADSGKGFVAAEIHEKREELQRAIWWSSDEGLRARDRCWAARQDEQFQGFKRLALGLVTKGVVHG